MGFGRVDFSFDIQTRAVVGRGFSSFNTLTTTVVGRWSFSIHVGTRITRAFCGSDLTWQVIVLYPSGGATLRAVLSVFMSLLFLDSHALLNNGQIRLPEPALMGCMIVVVLGSFFDVFAVIVHSRWLHLLFNDYRRFLRRANAHRRLSAMQERSKRWNIATMSAIIASKAWPADVTILAPPRSISSLTAIA